MSVMVTRLMVTMFRGTIKDLVLKDLALKHLALPPASPIRLLPMRPREPCPPRKPRLRSRMRRAHSLPTPTPV